MELTKYVYLFIVLKYDYEVIVSVSIFCDFHYILEVKMVPLLHYIY